MLSRGLLVLPPYEITLFSNSVGYKNLKIIVLLPYEITLFSNDAVGSLDVSDVLLPYEITLFSNLARLLELLSAFYYLMKLHYSQT